MLALFSNNNFDKYAKEELESIFTPETRVLCFSGSDIRWQMDNREEEQDEVMQLIKSLKN